MARIFIMLFLGSVAVWAQSQEVRDKENSEVKIDTSTTRSGDQNRQLQKQEEQNFKIGPYDREGNYKIELEEKDADLPD